MQVALVRQHHVLRNRIDLKADAEQFLPREVEHHVVLHDLDEDTPFLPEQRDVPRRPLAVVDDRERSGEVGLRWSRLGPTEALKETGGERRRRVASPKTTGEIEDEPTERRLERPLATNAGGRWRAT